MAARYSAHPVETLPARRGGGGGGRSYTQRFREIFGEVAEAPGIWHEIAVYESTTGAAHARRSIAKAVVAARKNGEEGPVPEGIGDVELESRVTDKKESRLYARCAG